MNKSDSVPNVKMWLKRLLAATTSPVGVATNFVMSVVETGQPTHAGSVQLNHHHHPHHHHVKLLLSQHAANDF